MTSLLTTRQAADAAKAITGGDIREWQIRRLYECELLPEPERFGGKRLISRADLPSIVAALRAKGWLPQEAEATAP